MLIAFCGTDGSGKTTQLQLLHRYLTEQQNRKVFCTKQPTDWYRNDLRVKQLLDEQVHFDEHTLHELALFSATDRLRHYQQEIKPHLQNGFIVLTDRYLYSAYAYFLARGLSDFEWLKQINQFVPTPDITFFLDVPSQTSIQRILNRDGIFKKEEVDEDRVKQIRQIFLNPMWEQNNYYVLDGLQKPDHIFKKIIQVVLNHLPNQLEG